MKSKIEISKGVTKCCKLKDIEIGSYFMYNEILYIRILESIAGEFDNYHIKFNSVSARDGNLLFIGYECIVKLVDVKIDYIFR